MVCNLLSKEMLSIRDIGSSALQGSAVYSSKCCKVIFQTLKEKKLSQACKIQLSQVSTMPV